MLPKDQTGGAATTAARDPKQILELYQQIQRSRSKLVGPDGRTENLPVTLYEFLVKLIAGLCEGQRSEEHTSELQSPTNLVCRLLLEKKNVELLSEPNDLKQGSMLQFMQRNDTY